MVRRREPIKQRRYQTDMIAFVIAERTRGSSWKEVGEAVRRRFEIKPPTERQMRTWWKRYGADRSTGVRDLLIKAFEESTQKMVAQSFRLFCELGIPSLSRMEELGVPGDLAPWLSVMVTLEAQLGSQAFDQLLEEYARWRLKLQPLAEAGMQQPTKQSEATISRSTYP